MFPKQISGTSEIESRCRVSIENGDTPAVPHDRGGYTGLTKRELFAAMAMQALMGLPVEMSHLVVARSAVEQADTLLAELAKKAGAS
jgi:hypothetical protein